MASSDYLDVLYHYPKGEHTHTLVLIHGRGSNAQEFSDSLFSQPTPTDFHPSNFPSWKIVMPSSQKIFNSAVNENRQAWFDQISLLDYYEKWDLITPGMLQSAQHIKGIIDQEIQELGGKSERLVVMGFSMGCATGLWAMLSLYGNLPKGKRLGAFVAKAGWLPFSEEIESFFKSDPTDMSPSDSEELKAEKEKRMEFVKIMMGSTRDNLYPLSETPVLWFHGTDDYWVNIKLGKRAVEVLRNIGIRKITLREYQGGGHEGHWFKEPEELNDIAGFLKSLEANE